MAMDQARPLGDVVATRGFVNRFRRYDLWRERLAGFVALGDSVCSFNPIYGQGMSAAAGCARILASCLESEGTGSADVAASFFRRQYSFLMTPWCSATASDFRYPNTVGECPKRSLVRERYLAAVFESAWRDPILHRRVAEVCHLVSEPDVLFAPSSVLRTAVGTLARGVRQLTSRAIPQMPPAPSAPRANSGTRFDARGSASESAPIGPTALL